VASADFKWRTTLSDATTPNVDDLTTEQDGQAEIDDNIEEHRIASGPSSFHLEVGENKKVGVVLQDHIGDQEQRNDR